MSLWSKITSRIPEFWKIHKKGIIIIAFALTGIYVKKANTDFDKTLNRLKDDVGVKHD